MLALAASGAAFLLGGLGLAVVSGGGAENTESSDSAQRRPAADQPSPGNPPEEGPAEASPSLGEQPGGGPSEEGPAEGGQGRPGEEGGPSDEGGSRTAEGYVACARFIVEGTVVRVTPVPGGVEDRIVLDVARYYWPSSGGAQVSFVMDVNVSPRLREGDHALVGVSKGSGSPDIWATGSSQVAKERAWIEDALPGARRIDPRTCRGGSDTS